ncbi:MAG: aminotransferase class I/II-fold pyridoxal phosphate-dependent enzyme [Candidatus Omnitrophica bacterium]|nr:aminotransferase class I/II-fold pyridoxal phosphate-dependent enzyme [Candidatus Omnitrophota bacterium]MBU0896070.1 aminotransferase class I/II-fold pyridoxal phosphate-dependent enzyme [Candidatus Omnitrophota bacterium]MBU1134112.1 aminotransferase class I/II-fold pyridoxal phosphate-dependent enzyme [Candidatus Omnitrophota bacterium]MBU1810093.1 aminotransferase class I/II-fold pyridoxal phosphate-dependent enzyme [Candidatus Omnitrophota bacterium]
MRKFEFSQNLRRLPPYLFAQIDRQKQELKKNGVKFIDLSIGDPDIPAPKKVIDTLYKCAKLKENQKYALDQGKYELRKAIKAWFKGRFKINLDENREVLPLIGSKEGLVHLPLGFVNKGDYVIIPSPGYPGYRGAAIFSGARSYELPLLEKNNFLPDLDKIPLFVRNKAKIIYLNYPNNPTTALAPVEFLKKLVKFCAKYGIILAYDNAYSEIYFEEKPHSILEVKGAEEIAIEFHSFSKTFSMTGFRIGWACGNKDLINGLLKVKTNIDSGIFGAVQEAGRIALDEEKDYVSNLRKIFKERKNVFVAGLKERGFEGICSQATFYVWAKIPSPFKSSIEFAQHLIKKKRIIATPGVGFGKYGERFIRFALTVDKGILKKAVRLIGGK